MHIGLGEGAGGLDIRRMTLQEISFIGTYTYTAQDFRDTAAAIFDGRLGALDWTEQRPSGRGQQAFDDIRAGRVAAPKIILEPQMYTNPVPWPGQASATAESHAADEAADLAACP